MRCYLSLCVRNRNFEENTYVRSRAIQNIVIMSREMHSVAHATYAVISGGTVVLQKKTDLRVQLHKTCKFVRSFNLRREGINSVN